jgi:hypothetical protein
MSDIDDFRLPVASNQFDPTCQYVLEVGQVEQQPDPQPGKVGLRYKVVFDVFTERSDDGRLLPAKGRRAEFYLYFDPDGRPDRESTRRFLDVVGAGSAGVVRVAELKGLKIRGRLGEPPQPHGYCPLEEYELYKPMSIAKERPQFDTYTLKFSRLKGRLKLVKRDSTLRNLRIHLAVSGQQERSSLGVKPSVMNMLSAIAFAQFINDGKLLPEHYELFTKDRTHRPRCTRPEQRRDTFNKAVKQFMAFLEDTFGQQRLHEAVERAHGGPVSVEFEVFDLDTDMRELTELVELQRHGTQTAVDLSDPQLSPKK